MKEKYTIKSSAIAAFSDAVDDLSKLLTARIEEMSGVKGMQGERHAFILYRNELWAARDVINNELK